MNYTRPRKNLEEYHIYKNIVGLTSSLGCCFGPNRFKGQQTCKYICKTSTEIETFKKNYHCQKNNQLDRHVTNILVGTILNYHRHITNIYVLTNISVGWACYKDSLFLERNCRSTSPKWACCSWTKVLGKWHLSLAQHLIFRQFKLTSMS